jgi:hypothetical protein
MSLRTSTKLKSFFDFKDEEVVPDVFDIPALSFDHFHDDFYELSEDEAMPSFRGDEVYFDAKEKKTKKKEKLPSNEGTLEQLFFPSAAVVSKSAKEKVRSNTKSSKGNKDLSLIENGKRREPSKKNEGVSKQSRSSPSLTGMGLPSSNENKKRTKSQKPSGDSPTNINAAWKLPDMNQSSSSNYGNARKSSKTDKDLASNAWNLVVAGLSSSSELERRRKSSKTNVDMPDVCLSSSSEHGGRRKAIKGSKDLIKKLGYVDLGPSSSLELETRRKSSTANRDSVKKSSSAPRLADMSLSSSSEYRKGRKPSKANTGLANHTWSLVDRSLSSSSEHRSKLSSKGFEKLDRGSNSGLSSSSEHRRRKLSSNDRSSILDSVKKSSSAPRLADTILSSSEHGKGRKTSKSNKGLANHTWCLADMSLSSSSEHMSILSSKGSDKLDRRRSSGLSSSLEHRRKLSSKGLDKLDRSSLLGLSSSPERRKRTPRARINLSRRSTSSPGLARMSLLSPLEDRKRRTRKVPSPPMSLMID